MSDEGKTSAYQSENVMEKPRKRGVAGHCAKFWWAYLVALVIITVIVVPVVILVAVPKIAQQKLDDAELTLDSIIMTNSQSENFTMSVNSVIRSDGKVHAIIEPFKGVMYIEDLPDHTPFATLDFPETTSEAFQVVNVTQFTKIDDMGAFTTFNTWLVNNETFRVTVMGDTHVKVKGIARRYPVTFKKTIDMPGLQMFAGTTVFDTAITLKPDAEGANFRGKARIPNRSLVTFEVGNATFHNYLFGEEVGTVYIDNLNLKPGDDNVFPMRANITQTPIVEAMGEKPWCDTAKGVLPFQLRGKNVTNNGQYLTYFTDALASGNQSVNIDIRTPFRKLFGSDLPCTKH
ncbi:hypothetical protein B0H66DRAFT_74560 [Apodospora peruviana]|uniref:Uncharacterized protein n=1 Tax=Apodospora peruviana TaxID=516989 RepID=A0AAE0MFN8_9PEZI|nr:hypothetical protein B0H66DRAFT_74560 [Apodospora peruviana]